jgi:hypothetical protein
MRREEVENTLKPLQCIYEANISGISQALYSLELGLEIWLMFGAKPGNKPDPGDLLLWLPETIGVSQGLNPQTRHMKYESFPISQID